MTIALDETVGNLDGAFQLYRDDAPYDDGLPDTPIGACQNLSTTYTALAAGKYYVAVRGMTTGAAGNLP